MRGEDNEVTKLVFDEFRITPACAGKTSWGHGGGAGGRDHPRMRGEDDYTKPFRKGGRGSPPHARGRPANYDLLMQVGGITPACAGKTPAESDVAAFRADHPRMRGEDCRTC